MKIIKYKPTVAKRSTRCWMCRRGISKGMWYLQAKITDDTDRADTSVVRSIHDSITCKSAMNVHEGVQAPDFYSNMCR